MFWLVGYRERLQNADGEAWKICYRWGGTERMVHAERRGALTVFGIPLIPYKKRRKWICTFCGKAHKTPVNH